MLDFLQRYILNFWIWWYVVANKSVIDELLGFWGFVLGKTNTVPMLTNLFKPLFQDNTTIGRFIAFPIRLIWVLVGICIQLIVTLPLLMVYITYLLMPIVPLWALINYFINIA